MIGIIDIGGGLRGSFGAGVLDWCIKNDVNFDYCIGVSAGSGNLASYLAKQEGRNLRFYTEYPQRKEYMSFKNVIKKRAYLDLDYIYSEITQEGGEDPLDYETFYANPAEFKIVATDAYTGLPVYFDKTNISKNNSAPFKASSTIPVVNKAYEHQGHKYYDGSIGNPIPYQKAFDDGCDKIVVIVSRPKNYIRTAKRDIALAGLIKSKYPRTANALHYRYKTYNIQMKDLKNLENEGKALIIAPDTINGLDTLTNNTVALQKLYWKGYLEAEKIKDFL